MTLFRSAAALLLALALGMAPTASSSAVDAQLLAQVHRVAIVASLGDRADIMLRGMTVFDTKGGNLPLPGSDLDDAASRLAAALLGSRFEIVPVTYDKTVFVRSDDVNPGGGAPSLKTLIRAMPPAVVDAYLVIRKQDFFLPYPDRYVMNGLGALRYRRILPKSLVRNLNGTVFALNGIVFVDLEATLVEAGTGKILIDKDDMESIPEDEGDWAVAACLAKMHLSAP
jgi:hypothetical protein